MAAGAAMLFGVATLGSAFAADDTMAPAAAPADNAAAPAAAPAAAAPAAAAPAPAHHMHMHKHMMGSTHVKAIQEALNHEGAKLAVDGRMGKNTRDALKSFQTAHGLKATGHADAKTLEALGLKGAKKAS